MSFAPHLRGGLTCEPRGIPLDDQVQVPKAPAEEEIADAPPDEVEALRSQRGLPREDLEREAEAGVAELPEEAGSGSSLHGRGWWRL